MESADSPDLHEKHLRERCGTPTISMCIGSPSDALGCTGEALQMWAMLSASWRGGENGSAHGSED